MKKYIIYIGLLVVGIILGGLFFGGNSNKEDKHGDDTMAESDQMWTCSMHPQIMQSEPGGCPICGMDLIPAENGSDGLMADQFKLTENAMALANIQTSIVGTGKTENNTIKLTGKIVENEEANSMLVSHFAGRIEKLAVNATGETVKNGQLVARIYSPELFAAQQELITASSIKQSQPALYKAVRNKLKIKKLTENQINQIETSGVAKEAFPIYSRVTGTVLEKLVEEGSHVIQGQPLFKINKLNTVWGNFDVYENQIDLFRKGQDISITTNAYPNKEFKAKVNFIDPVLDTKTRTVKLRVVLSNTNNVFKPGMFVEGRIKRMTLNKEQVLTVPSSAILWTGERSVVYLKPNPDQPVFEMREVVLGNQVGDEYEVLEGLFIGNEIVTNGTFTVDAAAQLQGKKSMMNKDGGKVMTGHEGHIGMGETTSKTNEDHSNMTERIKVSVDFQNQLKMVFNDYIILKDALVKDDSDISKKAANDVLKSLEKIDMKLLTNKNAHNHWMSIAKGIKVSASSIAGTNQINEHRKHFKSLSSHFALAVQLFGINQKVFKQFCPMADSNKGAYWLSLENEIRNPYFGAAMHNCGSDEKVIYE